jgi:hypothetical protein
MTFQLWEAESADLIGSYESEDAALAIVRRAIEQHGREAVDTLVLLRRETRGELSAVSEGAALADLALTRTSPAA